MFFDIDGVLLNSLPQHLQICQDLARDYGLDLTIPSPDAFRALIAKGVPISPMRRFFEAVGFNGTPLEKAVETYEANFAQHYPSPLFDGAEQALHKIKGAINNTLKDNKKGATRALGIVTANTQSNIEPMLGTCLDLFTPELCFFFDAANPISKAQALKLGMARFNARKTGAENISIKNNSFLYIGDQPSDMAAAKQADMPFLAVTYGWGFLQPPEQTLFATSINEVAQMIIGPHEGAP